MYTQEEFINPLFTNRPHWDILTTTVYSLSTASSSSSATPWPYAAVNSPLLHPITLKPHPNLPADLNLQNFDTTAVSSFHHTDISFDKFVKIDDGVFLVLYGGGTLLGRLRLRLPWFKEYQWVRLGQEEFDDVVIFMNKIHAVDRIKKLCFVNINKSRNRWRLGKGFAILPLISRWRKRLVVDGAHLYMVARTSSTYFSVFELDPLDESGWSEVWEFDGGKVLFVSKDCCFFMSGFGGSEYRNCIVFSEAGFPSCRDWRTLTKWGDEIWVFRLSDGRYGKVGATARFPEIDWSPPSWVFDGGSCLSLPSRSHSQREGNEEDGKVQSDPNESNSEDEEQDERVVSKIQSDANIDRDADASLLSQRPPPPRTSTQPYPRKFNDPSFTDRCHWDILTTTIHSLSSSSATPWPCAAVDDNNSSLLHPLTLKPHHNLNTEVNLNNFKTTALTSFYHTNFSFDKIVKIDDSVMLVLYGGGKLIGRLPRGNEWVRLRQKQFDDIVVFMDKIHAVDRYGRLSLVNVNNVKNTWKLGKMVVSRSIVSQWRERLVVDGGHLYLVIRHDERKFSVYKLVRLDKSYEYEWTCVSGFDSEKVLFVSKDCCFFMKGFGGRKYRNCIVYSESGFPLFNNHCWRTVRECEDEIWVYRMRDRRSGKVGESVDFPEIDWSPPSWIFDGGSCSFPHSRSHSEGEGDEEDGGVQSDSKESNTEDEDDKEIVMLDSDSHDQEQEERVDSEIESDANIERDASFPDDLPPSLLADVAAVEEEVTRTLLRMSGGNEAIEEESSRRNATLSAPRACTSSSTNKRHKIDPATAKFEGFDIRCDLVPTLQKIWRNHGNITENIRISNYDITARALESLAIVVQILENTSVGSLSDGQADYLSSTLSDLKFMSFKVHWLSSFVEKAVKLHKSKALVDCLHKLGQLSSQVTERRAILLDEVAKLNEEENKLKKEMATVSKLFPFSEQLKYDESLGAGLT